MPIAYQYDPDFNGVVLTVSGVISTPERRIMLRVAEFLSGELGIRNVLLDCSGLTANGDVGDAMTFARQLSGSIEIFRGLRIAVLPAREFFYIPSVAVLAFQDAGVAVIECENEREARAWLTNAKVSAVA